MKKMETLKKLMMKELMEKKLRNIFYYISLIQISLKAKELFSQLFHFFEEFSIKNEKDLNYFFKEIILFFFV